jgi:hypothetical protein
MFCVNCGEILQEHTKFCTRCGAQTANAAHQNPPFSQTAPRGPAIGFSPRIQDPAYTRYLKNSSRWAGIFSAILAAAAVIGFFIAGQTGAGNMKNPQALFIGMAIGGMFLLIALFQTLRKKKDRTWDGQVVDKKVEHKTRSRETSEDSFVKEHYTLFTVLIRENSGKFHPLAVENDSRYFDYFQIGDAVRHHAGFSVYEKQDKTRDSYLFCIACGTKNEIYLDVCHRCKCPLLK